VELHPSFLRHPPCRGLAHAVAGVVSSRVPMNGKVNSCPSYLPPMPLTTYRVRLALTISPRWAAPPRIRQMTGVPGVARPLVTTSVVEVDATRARSASVRLFVMLTFILNPTSLKVPPARAMSYSCSLPCFCASRRMFKTSVAMLLTSAFFHV